jgi:hypothetical protein
MAPIARWHDNGHHGHDHAADQAMGGATSAFAGVGAVRGARRALRTDGAQLQAALQGGSVMTADGRTVAFAGVSATRDGMGWGRIAHHGTTSGR